VSRTALMVAHLGRADTAELAGKVARQLMDSGFTVRVLAGEAGDLALHGVEEVTERGAADGAEIVLALGGDGTLLRAAEAARPAGAPLLGVNLGRVGFLAEVEADDLDETVHRVTERLYTVDERLTLDVSVRHQGREVGRTWALNEASVEKGNRARLLEVLVSVDGRPLSRYGCDGVVCATPTGSTAYAWSAGGPVVWPEVEALLLVPISAHALFNRALVAAPTSTITVQIEPGGAAAVLWCDGRRGLEVGPGDSVEVRRGALPVRVVRLAPTPFTDRLVAKFALPVEGWRHPTPRQPDWDN
jgi:NAD+ kinase